MRQQISDLFQVFLSERDRWLLWSPVALAFGIGGYFLCPIEPSLWVGPSAMLVFIALLSGLTYFGKRHVWGYAYVFCIIFTLVSLGFSAGQIRTASVKAPVLGETLYSTKFSGLVLQTEHYPEGERLTLGHLRLQHLENHLTPYRIRLRLRGDQPHIEPGDWVSGRARIVPPGPPAFPGGFDFQRHAFFQQIGGFGFAFGKVTLAATAKEADTEGLGVFIARARDRISTRIISALEAPRGGIAAALMTGERQAVDPHILEDLRNAGLAHLLAISGLHIGLIAGIVFAGLRSLLVLVPGLALRYPIKKWAAVGALFGAFSYALVSGATLPTQRAFLMASIALLAVLLDRRGISLRAVAFAAFVVLLFQPESLLGPSFQMSFAAVIALVAGYEWWFAFRLKRLQTQAAQGDKGMFHKVFRYVTGVGATTVIASAATAPFALYHFHQFAEYSLFANLIAVPVTALWVMPWAVIGFVALPFGLENWALIPMGWGIEGVIQIAHTVANWPGAVTRLPAISVWSIVAISLFGIWLAVWRHRWRFLAIPGMAMAITSFVLGTTPDILVDGQARFYGVKMPGGHYAFSNLTTAKRDRTLWQRYLGEETPLLISNIIAATAEDGATRCDLSGCRHTIANQTVAISTSESALLEDCWSSDIVIALVPIRLYCPAKTRIDWFDLWRNGSHALTFKSGRVEVATSEQARGRRPWVQGKATAAGRITP